MIAAPKMYEALDEIALVTSYIISQTRMAHATQNIENGPRALPVSIEEAGEIIKRIHNIAATVLNRAEGKNEAVDGQ